MWRKDKYYVLHGMTLNWWFTKYARDKDMDNYRELKIRCDPGFGHLPQ